MTILTTNSAITNPIRTTSILAMSTLATLTSTTTARQQNKVNQTPMASDDHDDADGDEVLATARQNATKDLIEVTARTEAKDQRDLTVPIATESKEGERTEKILGAKNAPATTHTMLMPTTATTTTRAKAVGDDGVSDEATMKKASSVRVAARKSQSQQRKRC